jgi:hypothetical protein
VTRAQPFDGIIGVPKLGSASGIRSLVTARPGGALSPSSSARALAETAAMGAGGSERPKTVNAGGITATGIGADRQVRAARHVQQQTRRAEMCRAVRY